MKIKTATVLCAAFVSLPVFMTPASAYSEAELCEMAKTNLASVLQSHQSKSTIAVSRKYARDMCSGSPLAHKYTGMANDLKAKYDAEENARVSAEVGSAIVSFGLGFLEGYTSGGGIRQGGGARTVTRSSGGVRTTRSVSTGGTIRTVSAPARSAGTTISAPNRSVSPASTVSRVTPTTPSAVPVIRSTSGATVTTTAGSSNGVIGTIRQPNGQVDKIYSTRCKPRQTGTTSYDCGR